jgi:hypothetical protein
MFACFEKALMKSEFAAEIKISTSWTQLGCFMAELTYSVACLLSSIYTEEAEKH